MTNRRRTEGTANLLNAARRSGVGRIVAQGLGYAYDPHGPGLADESVAFWRSPPRTFAPVVAALREMEAAVEESRGTVLRYGHLYGPGSSYAADDSFTPRVPSRQVPVVGAGTATFSYTFQLDVAVAVVAALPTQIVGVFHLFDDVSPSIVEWFPELAARLGAPALRRAPTF